MFVHPSAAKLGWLVNAKSQMWIHWLVVVHFLGVKNIELRSMFDSTETK